LGLIQTDLPAQYLDVLIQTLDRGSKLPDFLRSKLADAGWSAIDMRSQTLVNAHQVINFSGELINYCVVVHKLPICVS
jgi:hypothetical protein